MQSAHERVLHAVWIIGCGSCKNFTACDRFLISNLMPHGKNPDKHHGISSWNSNKPEISIQIYRNFVLSNSFSYSVLIYFGKRFDEKWSNISLNLLSFVNISGFQFISINGSYLFFMYWQITEWSNCVLICFASFCLSTDIAIKWQFRP